MPALACLLLLAARLVWDGPGASHLGSPSPDGRYLTGIDPDTGDLLLRDLAAGTHRRLTRKPAGSKEFAYFSVFSRDSRSIAYAWFNSDGFYELRHISTAGGEPRTIYRNEEAGFVQPTAFTADGKQILTLLFRRDNISQITLISVESGAVKVMKSLNWVYPKRMDISPDNRLIVYDNFARDGASERDIFLLSTDGARETKLVESPAEDVFPTFSPDGQRVFYSSDGTLHAISLKTRGAVPISAPLGRFLPLGLGGNGELYYALRTEGSYIYRLVGDRVEQIGEGWSPAYSDDASRLAWLGRRPGENFGVESRYVAIRNSKTDVFSPPLAHLDSLRWNGPLLSLSGADGKGRGGLFSLDPATGKTQPVDIDHDAPHRGYPASAQYVAKRNQVFRGDESVLTLPHEITCLAASRQLAACTSAGLYLDSRLVYKGPVYAAAWAGDILHFSTPSGIHRFLRNEPKLLLPFAEPIESLAIHPNGKEILFSAGKARTQVWAIQP